MNPARLVALVLGAAALAAPVVAIHEGYVPAVYRDPAPAGYPTVCYGHRIDAPIGTRFSDEECARFMADDLVDHGIEIADCLPAELPQKTRAAFTSFAFNVGTGAFCRSTLTARANAGDLAGSCAELSRWTKAGGKTLPGLVRRRAEERALCEAGLKETT